MSHVDGILKDAPVATVELYFACTELQADCMSMINTQMPCDKQTVSAIWGVKPTFANVMIW